MTSASVASGRPYASAEELLASSDAATAGLAPGDLGQALAGHPRIGDRRGTDERSRREQAGVLAADQATIQALADGNEEYERRFGHIYLVCATGRNAADLLALPLIVDAAPPAVLELGIASTTVELTVHLRARPAPGWLACRTWTSYVGGGYHEEDFEVWDSAGTLVAQSRQLALILG